MHRATGRDSTSISARAVAAATFADAGRFTFVPLSGKDRFIALQSAEVDLLSRTTTWSMSRDIQLGFDFVAANFYDGRGLRVPKRSGIKSAMELS